VTPFDRLFSIRQPWQPLASDSMSESDSDDETRDLRVEDPDTSTGVLGPKTVSTCCCDSAELGYCTAAVTAVPVAAVRVESTPSPMALVSIEPLSCSTIRYPKGTRLWNSLLVRTAQASRFFSHAAVSSTASCCSEAAAPNDDAIF
jgi:hypothetical protein